jgi:RimJ/RimL family protein N-acetyltransferase
VLTKNQENPEVYEYKNLVVMPARSDELLASAYLRLKSEELIGVLFYEKIPTLCEFLSMYMRPGMVNLGSWVRTGDQVQLAGIGSLDIPKDIGGGHRKGEASMVFFKEFQRRDVTLDSARLWIQWGFDQQNLSVIHGCTPVVNKSALRFMKSLGFEYARDPIKAFTTHKGELCDVVISWMTKERWENLKPLA